MHERFPHRPAFVLWKYVLRGVEVTVAGSTAHAPSPAGTPSGGGEPGVFERSVPMIGMQ